jgi:hypothetical protein
MNMGALKAWRSVIWTNSLIPVLKLSAAGCVPETKPVQLKNGGFVPALIYISWGVQMGIAAGVGAYAAGVALRR